MGEPGYNEYEVGSEAQREGLAARKGTTLAYRTADNSGRLGGGCVRCGKIGSPIEPQGRLLDFAVLTDDAPQNSNRRRRSRRPAARVPAKKLWCGLL